VYPSGCSPIRSSFSVDGAVLELLVLEVEVELVDKVDVEVEVIVVPEVVV
jgi:hypothetical protein